MERRASRRHAAGMSVLDSMVIWLFIIVLVVLGFSAWRDYHERTAGVDCENEAPQLARFTGLPLAACAAPKAAPSAPPVAAARPAAKVDRSRLAGEISDSWFESMTLSFDGGDAVLAKRKSWLHRVTWTPVVLVVALLAVGGLAAVVVSMGAGLINLVARLFRRAPGAGEKTKLITDDRLGKAMTWAWIAVGTIASGIVIVSAARTDTIRISPAQARVASSGNAFGFGVGTPMSRGYHAVAAIKDRKGRAFLKFYARDSAGRLASVYRLEVREDRLALAELLKPARPAR